MLKKYFLHAVFIALCSIPIAGNAQLGFCQGNSGSPIFSEDFGTGITNGPALPPGTTTYTYVDGAPDDGSYTIASSTAGYFDWFNIQDHTPDDVSGKAFIVNASFTPGEFYRRSITGLCENTSYEFSSWLLNLHPRMGAGCPNSGIPINVKFEIWDSTDTNLLASGDTGDIMDKTEAEWEQYALLFTSLPGQTSVILKMINNSGGGCGNDLAIDDIVFRSCGDLVTLTDTQTRNSIIQCEEDGPVPSLTLTASPDFSIFTSHFYQWQESTDASTWTDIPGETSDTYTTPVITTDRYYRVVVSEDLVNISNNLCNVNSEVFEIVFVPTPNPPSSIGDIRICENIETGLLTVRVPPGIRVDWYDAPSGGNLLASNTITYATEVPGTYYAEAVPNQAYCPSLSRTAVTLEFYPLPEVEDEDIRFCENEEVILDAGVSAVSYLWSTGETTSSISVTSEGVYTVEVRDSRGCSNVKTIRLTQVDAPVIDTVISEDDRIVIRTVNTGDFQYSLDGLNFQEEPFFEDMPGGLYTVYVRSDEECPAVQTEFFHLAVPKFFTPNGDGVNDFFEIQGIDALSDYEISLFDRYGKLIVNAKGEPLRWDGSYNNRLMPSGDYWYTVRIEDHTKQGHFALIR
ncbi:gliding motility-associated C-terminal domain-containing protein [Muriicola jejuensis]|uniref:T9SS type B sorting domain-containing protein n=1 Tax=Muriicola jejuensis TaxID=504488 RepID=A0A6P0UCS1_9FLAO|nr:T9SS type B sorting domain-containing protein [Muriicola jejuensis]NER10280.1 T9SS type B sorting domain-containing protein [Muriicola jejuensis]SMP01412.1 gliding motility-associated C-terminal domain-containing protein [Muriicola jejuensis]